VFSYQTSPFDKGEGKAFFQYITIKVKCIQAAERNNAKAGKGLFAKRPLTPPSKTFYHCIISDRSCIDLFSITSGKYLGKSECTKTGTGGRLLIAPTAQFVC
jgi:hypothetical protein